LTTGGGAAGADATARRVAGRGWVRSGRVEVRSYFDASAICIDQSDGIKSGGKRRKQRRIGQPTWRPSAPDSACSALAALQAWGLSTGGAFLAKGGRPCSPPTGLFIGVGREFVEGSREDTPEVVLAAPLLLLPFMDACMRERAPFMMSAHVEERGAGRRSEGHQPQPHQPQPH
jgi:hypothetical protein